MNEQELIAEYERLRRIAHELTKLPGTAARKAAHTDERPHRMARILKVFGDLNRPKPERFTLHDFRRTTITDLQMAGVSEKETSLMVGATPEVIRKHYEKLEAMTIAKRSVLRRLAANGSGTAANPNAPNLARRLRAGDEMALDNQKSVAQTVMA